MVDVLSKLKLSYIDVLLMNKMLLRLRVISFYLDYTDIMFDSEKFYFLKTNGR